jgi:4-carboxymuconolactone decarboxylase
MTVEANLTLKNAVTDDHDLGQVLLSINPDFGELCVRVCGEVWGKPMISQKTKCLITIALDVANQSMDKGSPFEAHVNMALKQGASFEEIEELLLFTCAYCGFNKAAGAYVRLNEIKSKLEQTP